MDSNVKPSQQDHDTQAQEQLTGKVGVRLTRPEKQRTSPLGAIKRLLRIG